MPSYTTLLNVNLSGSDTSPSAAGSTTGVGNGLVDRAGTQYSINNHRISGRIYSQVGFLESILYLPTAVLFGRATMAIPASTTEPGVAQNLAVLRISADLNKYYVVLFQSAPTGVGAILQIYRVDRTTSAPHYTNIYNHQLASGVVDNTAAYTLQASASGSSPTTIAFTLIDHLGATVYTDSTTDSTAGYQAAGYLGVGTDNNNNPAYLSSVLLESGDSFSGTTLTPGTITATTIGLAWTAATGGTGTITYKLYGSQTAGFTPGSGNLLYTGSGLTYTHTPPTAPGSAWFYAVIASDSTTPTAQTYTAPGIGVALAISTEVVCKAGDSIASYDHSAPVLISTLAALCPGRSFGSAVALDDGATLEVVSPGVTVPFNGAPGAPQNTGTPGNSTLDWLPTSTNVYLKSSDGITRNSIDHCVHWANIRGATILILRLGTNDSKVGVATTPSNYAANMTTIAAHLKAYIPTLHTIGVADPPYVVPGSTTDFNNASPGLTRQYCSALTSVDNGTTIRRIGIGVWDLTATGYPAGLSNDGIHPSPAGNTAIDTLDATGLAQAAGYLIGSGSGGSSVPTAYLVPDWPSATTAAETYHLAAIFNGSPSATGSITLPATTGITWNGGTSGAAGSAAIASGTNYATFTASFAAGPYSAIALTHTGGGFTGGDPTLGSSTATASTGGTYTAVTNVRSGTDRGDGQVGTLVVPSLANTKIGVAGDGGTGTYDGSDRWTDVGIGNVLAGLGYKANSTTVNRTGTLALSAGSGLTLASGVVLSSPAPSPTTFSATVTGGGQLGGGFNGMSVIFQGGQNAGFRRTVLAHVVVGSRHDFTLMPTPILPISPAAGDTFDLG